MRCIWLYGRARASPQLLYYFATINLYASVLLSWLVQVLPASLQSAMTVNNTASSPSAAPSANQDGQRPMVCLVTGGSGLVGRGLQWVLENEPIGSRFGKKNANEKWIFLSSQDGDLR